MKKNSIRFLLAVGPVLLFALPAAMASDGISIGPKWLSENGRVRMSWQAEDGTPLAVTFRSSGLGQIEGASRSTWASEVLELQSGTVQSISNCNGPFPNESKGRSDLLDFGVLLEKLCAIPTPTGFSDRQVLLAIESTGSAGADVGEKSSTASCEQVSERTMACTVANGSLVARAVVKGISFEEGNILESRTKETFDQMLSKAQPLSTIDKAAQSAPNGVGMAARITFIRSDNVLTRERDGSGPEGSDYGLISRPIDEVESALNLDMILSALFGEEGKIASGGARLFCNHELADVNQSFVDAQGNAKATGCTVVFPYKEHLAFHSFVGEDLEAGQQWIVANKALFEDIH